MMMMTMTMTAVDVRVCSLIIFAGFPLRDLAGAILCGRSRVAVGSVVMLSGMDRCVA